MRIATWNVNSVRQRLEHLVAWVKEAQPDIVCLQELKCQDEAFPTLDLQFAGYNVAVHGQKGFNGVAILSKHRMDEVIRGLPGDESDVQSRYIEAVISTPTGVVRVASIYLPNGNPLGTEKFPYKLGFMDRLIARAAMLRELEEPLILAGDYNVIPMPEDATDPKAWLGDALFQPESRGKYRELLGLGFADALRACNRDAGVYTFWDYQAGAWQRNNGIRIDHIVLSPEAADKLRSVSVEKHVRSWDKPSDHVPVMAEFAF